MVEFIAKQSPARIIALGFAALILFGSVLLQGIRSSATNCYEKAFKYSVPKEAFKKAAAKKVFMHLINGWRNNNKVVRILIIQNPHFLLLTASYLFLW